MDENKSPIRDDEFQFSDAEMEGSSPFSTAAATDTPSNSKVARRRVLIAIGIIVVALSLYKLIGVFFGEKTPRTITTVTKTQPISTEPTSFTPAIPSKSLMQSQPTTSVTQPVVPVSTGTLPTAGEITKINADLTQLSTSVNSLQSSIASINQQLQTITAQLQQQQTMIETFKPVKHQKIPVYKREIRRYLAPRANWHVAALIPGRAWLMRSNGSTLTVKVGDVLPGYGTIRYISVVRGIVATSSGVVIRSRGL